MNTIKSVKLCFHRPSADPEILGKPVYGRSTYYTSDMSLSVAKVEQKWLVRVSDTTARSNPRRFEEFHKTGLGEARFDTLRAARAALSAFLHEEEVAFALCDALRESEAA